jgi:hypothetical protein
MSIETIPVWSLYPDWADGVTETLEFLTTVAASPSAIEQRRGLRLTPRQYFEYSYVLGGPERTYFDLLTMRSGGSPCYVPLWHDVEILPYDHVAGSTVLAIDTTYTEFMNCDAVFIGSTHDYELAEIQGRAEALVVLTSALINTWPKGTRVAPMKKMKLDQQPSTTRKSSNVHIARVKFCSLEDNRTDAEPPLNNFGYQYVLEEDPNEADDLSYNYERVMSLLDNTTGVPVFTDVTGQVLQKFSWFRRGRAAHHRLRGLFYSLDGRRLPVWVPTIYSDFEPVYPVGAGDLAIDVKRCGYTNLGGPGPQREYILIHLQGGTRFYRKITSSVILGDGTVERLFIDNAIGEDVPLAQLRRISFLVLCRLDQDAIEFQHHTASRGLITTEAVFRSAAARDGIENVFEVPPGIVSATVCLSDLTWFNSTFDIRYGSYTDRLDQYGNYYITSGFGSRLIEIYNPNGVLLRTYDTQQLGDALNSWAGSNVFVTNPTYYECFGFPIRQGKYVLVYAKTQGSTVGVYDKWWVLMEPVLNGSLTVRGAVVNRNLTGPPYTNTTHVYDVFDDESVILVEAYFAIGSTTASLLVLPSIAEFLAGTYNSGWPGLPSYAVPTTMLYPIGNRATLSDRLFIGTPGNQSKLFGFKLPGIGRELLYVYINRSYMDYIASGGSFACPEIRDVILPYYPNGCILRIPLGDLSSFADIASIPNGSYKGRPTEDYTIDNADWRDADGGPAVPFLDEFTYLSDGSVGGTDVYSHQVSAQLRTNGKYWVIFLMTGYDDAIHRGTGGVIAWGSPVYAKVRVFEYDPAFEVGTQIFEHVCALHTDTDIPRTPFVISNDLHLIAEIVEIDTTGTVVLHGPIFKTAFCRFGLPEE